MKYLIAIIVLLLVGCQEEGQPPIEHQVASSITEAREVTTAAYSTIKEVVDKLEALGYSVSIEGVEGKSALLRISWGNTP
jgi:hypothetical protein